MDKPAIDPKTISETVVSRLYALRKLKGISRKDAAKACGMTSHAIQRIEEAGQPISLEFACRLCKAYGVHLYDIVRPDFSLSL